MITDTYVLFVHTFHLERGARGERRSNFFLFYYLLVLQWGNYWGGTVCGCGDIDDDDDDDDDDDFFCIFFFLWFRLAWLGLGLAWLGLHNLRHGPPSRHETSWRIRNGREGREGEKRAD